jgi:hypothetical protein
MQVGEEVTRRKVARYSICANHWDEQDGSVSRVGMCMCS